MWGFTSAVISQPCEWRRGACQPSEPLGPPSSSPSPQDLGLPLPAAPLLMGVVGSLLWSYLETGQVGTSFSLPCPKADEGGFPTSWPETMVLFPPEQGDTSLALSSGDDIGHSAGWWAGEGGGQAWAAPLSRTPPDPTVSGTCYLGLFLGAPSGVAGGVENA